MQIFECVHAVAGVDVELLEAGPAPALRNLIGTSFHLGVQRFMSAAHVLREVERYPLRAITYFVGPEIRFAPVSEIEYAEHLDIGVFRAEVPNAATPRWSFRGEALLEGIVAGGFPYALDTENKSITVRTFRGYIVAAYRYIQMTGQPGVYETSFQSPRGLSGAPLWIGGFGVPLELVGIVVANRSTEMLAFSERERTREGLETVVERFEALQLGIAIQSAAIADIPFQTLGSTVRAYVDQQQPSP